MDSTSANKQLIEQLPKIAHRPEHFETLFDAATFRNRLLENIAQAQHRIYLVALYLQDDEAGRLILDALIRRQEK